MGQLVGVIENKSTIPGMVRYELNRNLTGSGHEKFSSALEAVGPRPAAELARRLFGTGQVASVHVYMNTVTVDLGKGCTADGLFGVIRDMYQYWKPGMAPPAFEDLVPAEEPDVAAGAAPSGAGGGLSEIEQRVPAALLERSRAAMAKWKAAQAG
ncbi:unannotated protein [freshwater metagenome]|uniref:Unannotated protein n=1 Tax=freshwater metagenome TaxID=449393 RepID=A0A6J7ED35_9ZZZZ|nr:hypothetical protein [Actinomycetota bacterium]